MHHRARLCYRCLAAVVPFLKPDDLPILQETIRVNRGHAGWHQRPALPQTSDGSLGLIRLDHSEGNRSGVGAQRRWHFDAARNDRNRQADLSGARVALRPPILGKRKYWKPRDSNCSLPGKCPSVTVLARISHRQISRLILAGGKSKRRISKNAFFRSPLF